MPLSLAGIPLIPLSLGCTGAQSKAAAGTAAEDAAAWLAAHGQALARSVTAAAAQVATAAETGRDACETGV